MPGHVLALSDRQTTRTNGPFVRTLFRHLSRDPLAVVIAALGVLGLIIALSLHQISFPLASINFRVLPADALRQARSFLAQQGHSTTGYDASVSFEADDNARSYLEKLLGPKGVDDLARGDVSLWHWRVRFFRPLQEEEFAVLIDPSGRIVGYSHVIPEAQPGDSLSGPAAMRSAADTLGRDLDLDLSSYHLMTSGSEQRPSRLDWYFVWERNDFRIGEATYRLSVTVQGSHLDGFREYVKVPEAWSRRQAAEVDRGWVLVNLGWALTYGLALAMVVVFLLELKAGRLHWEVALIPLGVLTVIGLATALNSLPLFLAAYPTTSELGPYLAERVLAQLTSAAPLAFIASLAALGGSALRSRLGTDPTPLHRIVLPGGLASRQVVKAILVGYAMAGVWLGYVVLFYWLGTKYLGVWSPAELPYQDVMSTLVPAVYPLTVGAGAAITEEFIYRLFCIPLLLLAFAGLATRPSLSFLRSRGWSMVTAAVAIVVPAAIWGSLHSTYPQQPFFIRAVEVSLVGIVEGLIFLRYGILATICSHYVYNASIIGGLFLLSSNLYLQVSAVAVLLLPLLLLLPAVLCWRQHRSLHDLIAEEATTPSSIAHRTWPLAQPTNQDIPIEQAVRPSVRLLSWRGALLASLVTGSLIAWVTVPPLQPGSGLSLRLSRANALQQSEILLDSLGLANRPWWVTTRFADWTLGHDAAYLYRELGLAEANRVLANDLGSYPFTVRYYWPEQKEEVRIRLTPQGALHSFIHVLDEDAPGANLSLPEAQEVAESFLQAYRLADLSHYRLVTTTSEQRPHRTDHYLTWERTARLVGDGSFRLQVVIQGDNVGAFQRFFKTPESFDRELDQQTALSTVSRGLRSFALTVVWASLVVAFVRRFRADRLRWRWAVFGGGLLTTLSLIAQLNQLPTLMADYSTTSSPEVFVASRAAYWLMGLPVAFAEGALLVGLGEALYRERLGPSGLWPRSPRAWELALPALAAVPLVLAGIRFYWLAADFFARSSLLPGPEVPAGLINTWSPALQVLVNAGKDTIAEGMLALVAGLLLWQTLRNASLALVAAGVLLVVVQASSVSSAAGFALVAGFSFLATAVAAAYWRTYLGCSLWAYLGGVFACSVAVQALFLLSQANQLYWLNGWMSLAAIPLILILAWGANRATRSKVTGS